MRLQQLDDDGEPLLAGTLRHRHLLDDLRPPHGVAAVEAFL